MEEEKPVVNVNPIGVTKDGMLIFKLNLEDYGPIGKEKAKELGLIDAEYKFGKFENWMPVAEGEMDEPEEVKGFINEKQPIRGDLEV